MRLHGRDGRDVDLPIQLGSTHQELLSVQRFRVSFNVELILTALVRGARHINTWYVKNDFFFLLFHKFLIFIFYF